MGDEYVYLAHILFRFCDLIMLCTRTRKVTYQI